MRVLHVSTAREWRGGQTQLLRLVEGSDRALVALPPDARLTRALGSAAIAVPFRGRWSGTGALAAICARVEPDLLAAHDAHALVHALRVAPDRVVAHRRVDFVPSVAGVARLRRCVGVVAVSAAVGQVLRRRGIDRVRVVHDGVPELVAAPDRAGIRRALGLAPEASLVVAVGALVAHKDHASAIRAIASRPGSHLAILGEGGLRSELVSLARRCGAGDRIHLVGHRPDVARWLASADVVVHPSREEGLGSAVIEAVGLGACVVTTDAGGLPEIPGIAHRVPRGDAPALASALVVALADPERGRRVALAARAELRAGFGVRAMVDGTRDAYVAFVGDDRRDAR